MCVMLVITEEGVGGWRSSALTMDTVVHLCVGGKAGVLITAAINSTLLPYSRKFSPMKLQVHNKCTAWLEP